jgi:hypothetical protein
MDEIKLFPEINSKSQELGLIPALRLWYALRLHDTQGRGLFSMAEVSQAALSAGVTSERRVMQLLDCGNGVLWLKTQFKGELGYGIVLYAPKRVAKEMGFELSQYNRAPATCISKLKFFRAAMLGVEMAQKKRV